MDTFAPYTDISYMLNQLKVGDMSVLSSSRPYYGDFSNLSNNPADVINTVRAAESAFGQLPAADRAAYGNDWRVWFTSQLQACSDSVSVDGSSDSHSSVEPVVQKEVSE
nr:virion structural protein [Microvirus sp.]